MLVGGAFESLFNTYFSDRFPFIKMENCKGDLGEINIEVPQWSTLCPMLCLIWVISYVNREYFNMQTTPHFLVPTIVTRPLILSRAIS